MQSSSNRSVVIISGLLTLLVLGGAMLTLAFRNGWLQAAPTEPGAGAVTSLAQAPDADAGRTAGAARGVAPVSPSTTGTDQGEVAINRGELEDAYRALDEAIPRFAHSRRPSPRLALAESVSTSRPNITTNGTNAAPATATLTTTE